MFAADREREESHEKAERKLDFFFYLSRVFCLKEKDKKVVGGKEKLRWMLKLDKQVHKSCRVVKLQLIHSVRPSTLSTCRTNTQALIKNAQAF